MLEVHVAAFCAPLGQPLATAIVTSSVMWEYTSPIDPAGHLITDCHVTDP